MLHGDLERRGRGAGNHVRFEWVPTDTRREERAGHFRTQPAEARSPRDPADPDGEGPLSAARCLLAAVEGLAVRTGGTGAAGERRVDLSRSARPRAREPDGRIRAALRGRPLRAKGGIPQKTAVLGV
jgi:hypothetical protein